VSTDAFRGAGAHNGHNSWLNVIANGDAVDLAALCGSTAGVKGITVGIGGAEIG
jgi:hypothetical protein